MKPQDEQTLSKLRSEYLDLVKKGILYQKKGDIKAYTKIALVAENVAQQFQAISRNK